MRRRSREKLGIAFLTLGMSPLWTRAETPVMPKARYRIMTNYMPKVGKLGLDMMYRTSTVQVNMDYESEADMVKKLRVSLALQPIATAIFANSPFTDGKPNGYLVHALRNLARHGSRPHRHDGFRVRGRFRLRSLCGMGARRADVFHQARLDLSRCGRRLLPAISLAGKLAQLPGELATHSDWANHVSTLFPEVRLKRYLEMRGADVGGPEQIVALSAFWTGMLYDETALDDAWELVKGWSAEGARTTARRRAETRAEGDDRRPFRAGCRARYAGPLACRPASAAPIAMPQGRTRRNISPTPKRSSVPAAHRRSAC